MIRLESTTTGVIIPVRAQPGARKNAIVGEHDGALKVAVTAPADKGRANEAIVELLAKTFELPHSAVQLVAGQTSRQKRFLLEGMDKCVITAIVERITQ